MTGSTRTSREERDTSEEQPTEHIYVGDGTRRMSHMLFAALEQATDVDLTDEPPLGYVIDLDAIDMLYASYDEDTRGELPVVSFRYRHYEITIENHREIRILDYSGDGKEGADP